jgi:hypothetical protein
MVLAAASLMGESASAGAWTQPTGEWFVSASTTYYRTDPSDRYEEVTGAIYAEYGFTETLTFGGQIEAIQPVGSSNNLDGEFKLSAFARQRIHVGELGDPVSLQFGIEAPFTDDAMIPQESGDVGLDFRALYGRGFGTPFGNAFYDLQGAVRLRLGDDADEVRVDLTTGIRPAENWLLLLQSFSTIGLSNEEPGGDDFSVTSIAPSVGYELGDGITLVVGAEREIAGRNVDLGTRFKVGVWANF